jgi:hypothetical protein
MGDDLRASVTTLGPTFAPLYCNYFPPRSAEVPNESKYNMGFVADYGLGEFDQLLSVLDEFSDLRVFEAVSDLLDNHCVRENRKELTRDLGLSRRVADRLIQLESFGNEDTFIQQPLGSVIIAWISGGSPVGRVDCAGGVLAWRERGQELLHLVGEDDWTVCGSKLGSRRKEPHRVDCAECITKAEVVVEHSPRLQKMGQIIIEERDENGGQIPLGERDEPPAMRDMIQMVDAFLFENAPGTVSRGDWRPGYLRQDPDFELTIRSEFYPELERWYRESVAEWYRENSKP